MIVQEIQRERDEAVQTLESRTRQLDRAQRDWTLEKQAAEAETRTLRKQVMRRGHLPSGV